MDTLIQILAGFALSAPAGLNAWLPLLIVGLAARFTNLIHLSSPYNLLSNGWVLLALCVLLFVEIMADKVPVVDSVNNAIHTFIRPVAGAILFAAYNGEIHQINPALALILGLLAAGSVHAVKTATRPVMTVATGGVATPFVSIAEDVLAAVSVVLALVLPVVAAILFLLAMILAIRWLMRRQRRNATRSSASR
ncbi:MAG: DUF4126 domain-containing protein [Chloroflexia bacterium]